MSIKLMVSNIKKSLWIWIFFLIFLLSVTFGIKKLVKDVLSNVSEDIINLDTITILITIILLILVFTSIIAIYYSSKRMIPINFEKKQILYDLEEFQLLMDKLEPYLKGNLVNKNNFIRSLILILTKPVRISHQIVNTKDNNRIIKFRVHVVLLESFQIEWIKISTRTNINHIENITPDTMRNSITQYIDFGDIMINNIENNLKSIFVNRQDNIIPNIRSLYLEFSINDNDNIERVPNKFPYSYQLSINKNLVQNGADTSTDQTEISEKSKWIIQSNSFKV